MQLISINIGKERPIQKGKKVETTGIFKTEVSSPVTITKLGLSGDTICDAENHGGEDQAVYVYGAPDYQWWNQALGSELAPGTFGENFTLSELESARCSIGDRFHLGSVILEVTAARIPCGTLAARMGDPGFVKHFCNAERPGLYCRVLQEGTVQVGAEIVYEPYAGDTITVIEMFREFYDKTMDINRIRRHLAAPIAIRDRVEMEARLRKLSG